jgi:hypothetical protein
VQGVVELPAVETFVPRCAHADGWADLYGAFSVLSKYLGVDQEVFYKNKFFWSHGVIPPWVRSTELLLFNSQIKAEKLIFTYGIQQASVIQKSGFKNVHAVGAPILYLGPRGDQAQRLKHSALVMPQHSLLKVSRGSSDLRDQFLTEVSKLMDSFKLITACLGPFCIEKGYFLDRLSHLGIPYIEGARFNDKNALLRIRRLMTTFETLITNGWGSHVAYALYFGMKVVIVGQPTFPPFSQMRLDKTYVSLDDNSLEAQIKELRSGEVSFLEDFRDLDRAWVNEVKIGADLLGESNILDPESMFQVLINQGKVSK